MYIDDDIVTSSYLDEDIKHVLKRYPIHEGSRNEARVEEMPLLGTQSTTWNM